jgi:hypothetical protein
MPPPKKRRLYLKVKKQHSTLHTSEVSNKVGLPTVSATNDLGTPMRTHGKLINILCMEIYASHT